MKIIFAGGGTAGSVMPLLAIWTSLKSLDNSSQALFIGTKKGDPERQLVDKYDIPYQAIYSGKLRRYFDIRNISDIFLILAGFFQSLLIIKKFKADVIVGAGGYISVPVIWAAWVFRKSILIHQQDIKPSLSNIVAINLADRITVTFEKSLSYFPVGKTLWTGNPVRDNITNGSKERAIEQFKLSYNLPILLVIGGGTGARSLNTITNQALKNLVLFCQIIHITGKGKHVTGIDDSNYQQFEFITDGMSDLLKSADLIVSRAGLSALSEFSILGKSVILIPLPKSHQLKNAEYYSEKSAAVVIQEKDFSPGIMVNKVKTLLNDPNALTILSENIKQMMKPGAAEVIAKELINIM